MPRVQVQGGGVVQFPDSMSPDEIHEALKNHWRPEFAADLRKKAKSAIVNDKPAYAPPDPRNTQREIEKTSLRADNSPEAKQRVKQLDYADSKFGKFMGSVADNVQKVRTAMDPTEFVPLMIKESEGWRKMERQYPKWASAASSVLDVAANEAGSRGLHSLSVDTLMKMAARDTERAVMPKTIHDIINARDEVYHATGSVGVSGISSSGSIHTGGGDRFKGVAVSRVPIIQAKDQGFRFVLDRSRMPPSNPTADFDFEKTGTGGIMNPDFEFESRTKDHPVPLSSAKKVIYTPGVDWSDTKSNKPPSSTERIQGHYENSEHPLPVEIVSKKELPVYRARESQRQGYAPPGYSPGPPRERIPQPSVYPAKAEKPWYADANQPKNSLQDLVKEAGNWSKSAAAPGGGSVEGGGKATGKAPPTTKASVKPDEFNYSWSAQGFPSELMAGTPQAKKALSSLHDAINAGIKLKPVYDQSGNLKHILVDGGTYMSGTAPVFSGPFADYMDSLGVEVELK